MNKTGTEPLSLTERLSKHVETEAQQHVIMTQNERGRLANALRRSSNDALYGFEEDLETRFYRLKSAVNSARIEMERDLAALKTKPHRLMLTAAIIGAISASLTWATLPILADKIAEALYWIRR